MSPTCAAHVDLAARALGPDPTDADLLAYADEVATCAACRRQLAIALRAHPKVLEQGGLTAAAEAWAALPADQGMAELASALTPRPRRWALAAGAGLAAVASVLVALRGVEPTPEPIAPVAPELGRSRPADVARAPAEGVPPGPPVAPARPVRRPVGPPPEPSAPIPIPIPVPAADWPPPAYEDLRVGSAKSLAPAQVRSLELRLSDPAPRLGGSVALEVVGSAESEITVCVTGPETGIVWRGRVPPGRVALTRGGSPIGYAFDVPGAYRFVVGEGAALGCDRPAHVVTVEVGGP